jgi:hypothetical protein
MRKVATAINTVQSKVLDQYLEKTGMTEYELLKTLLESFLDTKKIDKAVAKTLLVMALKEAYQILDQAP